VAEGVTEILEPVPMGVEQLAFVQTCQSNKKKKGSKGLIVS
jgi:hypothetical protein